MNNLQKTLAVISIILVILLLYFLFFVKYDRYGHGIVNTHNNVKILSIDSNSYSKLENRKIITLKNDNSHYEIITKNNWSFVSESNIWVTLIEENIDVLNGSYVIYLRAETIWYI